MRLEFSEICGEECRREQSAAAWRLLKKMIKQEYGRADVVPCFNENGKPMLDFCCFGLSHSGRYAACAVSDKPVGTDIQKRHPVKRRKAYRLFTAEESEYINADNTEERFFTLWTMKEAYIKAKGKKLADIRNVNLVYNGKLTEKLGVFRFLNGSFDEYFWSVCFEE